MAVAAYVEQLVLVLDRTPAVCAKFVASISVMVLDTPAIACIFALAAHEIRPTGSFVRKLAPAGICEDIPDSCAQNVVVVVYEDVPVGRGCAGLLRHAPRITNATAAVGKRIRVRLTIESVCRGVDDIDDSVPLLVHMPHADISLEGVAWIRRRIDERAPIAHRELRPIVHFGQTHPDKRHAVRVPCVDFVRDDMSLLVHKRDILAAGMVEVVVIEAVRVILANIDKNGEVRERLGTSVARHGKRKIALELFHHPVGVGTVVVVLRLA